MLQKEDMRWQINALGLVESLDSDHAITLRFFLDDSDPSMRASEKQRYRVNLISFPNLGLTQLRAGSTGVRPHVRNLATLGVIRSERPSDLCKHVSDSSLPKPD